jgi:hypothetical protein
MLNPVGELLWKIAHAMALVNSFFIKSTSSIVLLIVRMYWMLPSCSDWSCYEILAWKALTSSKILVSPVFWSCIVLGLWSHKSLSCREGWSMVVFWSTDTSFFIGNREVLVHVATVGLMSIQGSISFDNCCNLWRIMVLSSCNLWVGMWDLLLEEKRSGIWNGW